MFCLNRIGAKRLNPRSEIGWGFNESRIREVLEKDALNGERVSSGQGVHHKIAGFLVLKPVDVSNNLYG